MSEKKTNQKNKELTVKHNFVQYGGEFKKVRKQYLEQERKANDIVEKNTKKEKKALDNAFLAYNTKLKNVVKSDEYQKIQQTAGDLSKEMNKTLFKAKKEFMKVSDQIMKRDDWNDEKKQKKIGELYDYVISKFYTKEEIDEFKKMMSSMVVVRPN